MSDKIIIPFNLPITNRIDMRKDLVCLFLLENPGTGTGIYASKYKYIVDTFDRYTIYLTRPAPLNKGIDFIVNIDGIYFINTKNMRRHKNPSHEDIFISLENCKNHTSEFEYQKVKKAIMDIYNCIDVNLSTINAYFEDSVGSPHPIQIILLAIKWLFMEQDCTYWNFSGRAMLFDGLKQHSLV